MDEKEHKLEKAYPFLAMLGMGVAFYSHSNYSETENLILSILVVYFFMFFSVGIFVTGLGFIIFKVIEERLKVKVTIPWITIGYIYMFSMGYFFFKYFLEWLA